MPARRQVILGTLVFALGWLRSVPSSGGEAPPAGIRELLQKLLGAGELGISLSDPEGNSAFVGYSAAGAQARLLSDAARIEDANPEKAAELHRAIAKRKK